MKQFKDKVAVITGGASGIGLALARRSAAEGMQVVLADIEDAALAAAAAELKGTGAKVLTVKTDVSRAEDVENLAAQTLQAFGGVHLVFNNAGVGGVRVKTWEATAKDWEWVLGVNVWGVIHGVRVFTPIMLRQGDEGHIVNTASAAGFVSMASTAPYAVSKHSVVTLSEVLYHDLKAENAKVGVSGALPRVGRHQHLEFATQPPGRSQGPRRNRRGARPARTGARAAGKRQGHRGRYRRNDVRSHRQRPLLHLPPSENPQRHPHAHGRHSRTAQPDPDRMRPGLHETQAPRTRPASASLSACFHALCLCARDMEALAGLVEGRR